MLRKPRFALFLALAVVILVASACRLGAPAATATVQVVEPVAASPTLPATSLPPTYTPQPSETPWPSDTPEPTELPGRVAWIGLTSQDTAFAIDVQGDQIVHFNVYYMGQSGTCHFSGGFGDSATSPILENQFTIDWQDENGNTARITGTFTSDSQANGTVDYTDNVKEMCDQTMFMTWSAISPAAYEAGTPIAPRATLAVAALNGKWEGENSDGYQVYFDVVNEQITYVFFNYHVFTGSCSISGARGDTPDNAKVVDKSFSFDITDDEGQVYTFAGSFTSDNTAAGTIHIKGREGASCGAFDGEMTWNTERTVSQASPEPPTETPAPLPTATTGVAVDPIAVVQGFFDAYNAGDIDAALALVEDKVMFNLGSATGKIGQNNLKAFLTEQQGKGITYTLSGLNVLGTIVKFSVQASDGTAYPNSQAFIADGKITLLALK